MAPGPPSAWRLRPTPAEQKAAGSLSSSPMGNPTTFTVLVTDDHPVVREAVAIACEMNPLLDFVGEASTGAEALAACEQAEPDLVVVDLKLPDIYGADLVRTLKDRFEVKVLVLTATEDPQALFDCWSAGADGFQYKSVGVKELGDTLAGIAGGDEGFSKEQREKARARFGEIVKTAREGRRIAQSLSKREVDVLGLIKEGLTTAQMASRLQISHGTVESHLKNLYRKLDVNSRVQAVIASDRFGLTGPKEVAGYDRD